MGPRLVLVLGLLLVAVALAGCTDGRGPPVSSLSVPSDAPRVNGSGPVDLTVQVRQAPDSLPYADAAVAVYWGEDAYDGVEDASRPWTQADPKPATPAPEEVLRLRTGMDGKAVARVPAGETVGVVASVPGRTQEWIPAVEVGSDDRTVEIPLYHRSGSVARNVTLGPADASGGTEPSWVPRLLNWTDSGEHREAYQRRLSTLEAVLTWENGPEGGGDLALGIGVERTEPDVLRDEGNETTPGEHREEVALDAERVREEGWPDEARLLAGPATRSVEVSPLGLETHLAVEATFTPFPTGAGYPPFASQQEGGVERSTPLPAGLAFLAGAGGLALAGRRDP